MIHITYQPSAHTYLSSGHIFWEIFTTFIFVHFLEGIPVWHEEWIKSSIISSKSLKSSCATMLTHYDYVLKVIKKVLQLK